MPKTVKEAIRLVEADVDRRNAPTHDSIRSHTRHRGYTVEFYENEIKPMESLMASSALYDMATASPPFVRETYSRVIRMAIYRIDGGLRQRVIDIVHRKKSRGSPSS